MKKFLLTVITPAYNEANNLPVFHSRLKEVFSSIDADWEWIIVDDHSSDATHPVMQRLSSQDKHVRGFRLSRNFGSHAAIACGLHHAKGEAAVLMASDLQDPPEAIPQLLAEWKKGLHVVWAVRAKREGISPAHIFFAQLYYTLMRLTTALKNMPATGSDFLLVDRCVMNALNQFSENNASIYTLITWLGFRQAFISYDKQSRLHGRSGWGFKKLVKLFVDSITSFTYFPIRLSSYLGVLTALVGFIYAVVVFVQTLNGHPPEGWASLMIVILVIGGVQMLILGILGEYLWRALDESRRRPRYVIESSVSSEDVT